MAGEKEAATLEEKKLKKEKKGKSGCRPAA
jgi:hypothetical protein